MKYISKSLIINLPLLPTKDLTMKCNEEEKSLSSEAFSRVSLTNLRRSAVPDLSSDLGMNIFKKVSRTIYVLCILVIKKKNTQWGMRCFWSCCRVGWDGEGLQNGGPLPIIALAGSMTLGSMTLASPSLCMSTSHSTCHVGLLQSSILMMCVKCF